MSTDGYGYFRWENATHAKYNLKGFRMPMGQRRAVIIISRLRSPRDQYIVQETANIIPMSGRKFLYEPKNRVIDMGNFIFHYSRYGAVTMNHGSTFESFELAGDHVEAPYIQEYFLNPKKYNKSGWLPYLEESYIEAKSQSQIR